MSHFSFLILLICLGFGSLQAEHRIEECSSIRQLLEISDPTHSQLVILDIDNTLYHPKQMVGSDEWFDYFFRKQPKENKLYVLNLWVALQTITKVAPIEKQTSAVVQTLQNNNILLMAMTTRSPNIAFVTFQQLDSIGIHLEKTAPTKVRFQLHKLHDVHYGNGVLFTDGGHKGECLKEFLQQLQWTPKKVVYVNDKKEPLEEVKNSLPDTVDFLGLRYSGADHFIREFSSEIADTELKAFTSITSDEDAYVRNEAMSMTKR